MREETRLYQQILDYEEVIVSEQSLIEDYSIFVKHIERGNRLIPILDQDNLRIWSQENKIDFYERRSERSYHFKLSNNHPSLRGTKQSHESGSIPGMNNELNADEEVIPSNVTGKFTNK